MMQAILAGRKTQTRRVVKGFDDVNSDNVVFSASVVPKFQFKHKLTNYEWYINCPYGKPGDVLWVRETHWVFGEWEPNGSTKTDRQRWEFRRHIDAEVQFKQPGTVISDKHRAIGWHLRSPLFLRIQDARIWLRITKVRVERLNQISDDDAIDEGIERNHRLHWWKNYLNNPLPGTSSPIESFKSLWQFINGLGSWGTNPWVWVVEFERIEKPEI